VVSSEGKVYRIEPSDGITDLDKYRSKQSEIELRQDDDWFNSVVVGLGCMGVVYSVTLAVRDKHWLSEARIVSTWTLVKADLVKGEVLEKNLHYEVLVNPYRLNGEHTCLVTTRNEITEPRNPSPEKANRSPLRWGFLSAPPAHQAFGSWKLEAASPSGHISQDHRELDQGPRGSGLRG
jgi:hypothetical protein